MKKIDSIPRTTPGPIGLLAVVAAITLIAVLASGCAGRRRAKYDPSEKVIDTTPPFLLGPAAALLVNTNGYSTRVTLDLPAATGKVHAFSGQLLCQGTRLLFAPNGGDRIFMWDVRQHSGFIMSEALQGYAPISSTTRITNFVTAAEGAAAAANSVNGHPGHESEVAIASDDGSTAKFSVWCAADLDDFPVRIRSLNAPEPFTLNLLNLRTEKLAAKLFLPPEDFTPYASPAALTSELAARKVQSPTSNIGAGDEHPTGMPNRLLH
jgi:hypothetical protein